MNTKEKGFTLIELVLAVGIVIVALLGIMSANTTAERNSEAAFERSVAMQDANRVVEAMRDAANTGTSEDFQTDVISEANNAIASIGSLSADHNEQITVSYVDTTADPLDVTVAVSWDEQGLRATSISLRTLITRRS